MRILVQDIESGRYLASDSQWTPTAGDANDFPTMTLAYYFGKNATSTKFRVIFYFLETGELIPFMEGEGQAVARAAA